MGRKVGISEDGLEGYGDYKGKIDINEIEEEEKKGKVVLVSGMRGRGGGEGKWRVSVGLGDGFKKLNDNVSVGLGEGALGGSFGIKGGA
ncbi:formate--tetrahydrofolate ligase, partial [Staphylococcus epidermidis]|uniref:formate--tetrahydrofolate ligase n=1 Tax=Staphylococcus epidermidis TaxID=1282 RepID=UPI0021B479FB